MATAKQSTRSMQSAPTPPPRQEYPIIHGDTVILQHWVDHYWQKLQIPLSERALLAITQDRQEFMLWTGKRLNTMALGCYCYVSLANTCSRRIVSLIDSRRHLIFIEPHMVPQAIEVTVAHELIHLADRVKGTPRRHRHHGYDSIAVDEAAVTGYTLEDLRALLHEESAKREIKRRERRPIRYLYECPHCKKKYPRTRKYSHAVSCSSCDKSYNSLFKLVLSSYTEKADR